MSRMHVRRSQMDLSNFQPSITLMFPTACSDCEYHILLTFCVSSNSLDSGSDRLSGLWHSLHPSLARCSEVKNNRSLICLRYLLKYDDSGTSGGCSIGRSGHVRDLLGDVTWQLWTTAQRQQQQQQQQCRPIVDCCSAVWCDQYGLTATGWRNTCLMYRHRQTDGQTDGRWHTQVTSGDTGSSDRPHVDTIVWHLGWYYVTTCTDTLGGSLSGGFFVVKVDINRNWVSADENTQ